MKVRFLASRKALIASGSRSCLRNAMAAALQSCMAVSASARNLPSAARFSVSACDSRSSRSSSASDSLSSRSESAARCSSTSTELASISSACSTTCSMSRSCRSDSVKNGPSERGVQTMRGVMTRTFLSETPSLWSRSCISGRLTNESWRAGAVRDGSDVSARGGWCWWCSSLVSSRSSSIDPPNDDDAPRDPPCRNSRLRLNDISLAGMPGPDAAPVVDADPAAWCDVAASASVEADVPGMPRRTWTRPRRSRLSNSSRSILPSSLVCADSKTSATARSSKPCALSDSAVTYSSPAVASRYFLKSASTRSSRRYRHRCTEASTNSSYETRWSAGRSHASKIDSTSMRDAACSRRLRAATRSATETKPSSSWSSASNSARSTRSSRVVSVSASVV
mmetsp:Transcript_20271/g.80977  ORF Transcript_20271/g.80977 Transcript_20271/m.80977 type:complete len:395 (+) Transcript_20271:944-2128(+)